MAVHNRSQLLYCIGWSALTLVTLGLGCTGKVGGNSSGLPDSNTTAGGGGIPLGSGGSDGGSSTTGPESDSTLSTSSATGGTTSSGGSTGSGGTALTSGGDCTTEDVRTIFQAGCASSTCHDASQPAAELDLSGADPASVMLDVPSTLCEDQVQLVAGNPEGSLLWQKLTDTTPQCGDPMPIGSMLPSQELACIEQWILGLESGVPDCETCGTTTCVDVSNDAQHCGACGATCESGQVCAQGVCSGCPEGQTSCGTSCVDLETDPSHCGACGAACQVGEACVAGQCTCAGDDSISFARDIAPWLDTSCADNNCHGGRMAKEGLDLTPTLSYQELVGVVADQCSDGRLLVTPGSPGTSYLIHKLTGVDMCSGSLMPKADAAVDVATLSSINAWICSGAPDN